MTMYDNVQLFPVWVLNLERSVDRRKFMEEQLNRLGWRYEFIRAVDGRSLSRKQLDLYSKAEAMKYKHRELGRGEVGCALSHAGMWQRLVEDGLEAVLILEDDVLVGEMLARILSNIDVFPDDWDLVNFKTDVAQLPFGEPFFDIYKFCRFASPPNRTCAYLLSLAGARKLLREAFPIRRPVDDYIGSRCLHDVKAYGIDPQVVALRGEESDIWLQDDYYALERSGKTRVLEGLRRLLPRRMGKR